MDTLQVNRRAAALGVDAAAGAPDPVTIVRQGLLIQACLGTVGAVEYLKTRGVGAAVIARVLTSHRVRADDRTPAAHPAAR